jgi:hypothetical protein
VKDGESQNDCQQVVDTENRPLFPYVSSLLERFAELERGDLGRAMLVRLKPMGRVYPHVDKGAYYAVRDRYHLVIQSKGGSPMASAEETVILQEGELWCFDNKSMHSAMNPSADWRVHLIFDLSPRERSLHFVK